LTEDGRGLGGHKQEKDNSEVAKTLVSEFWPQPVADVYILFGKPYSPPSENDNFTLFVTFRYLAPCAPFRQDFNNNFVFIYS
jgi:hypothetical protein